MLFFIDNDSEMAIGEGAFKANNRSEITEEVKLQQTNTKSSH